jgi:peptide deformylase
MALHEIRILGDPVLRQPAKDVPEFDPELAKLVEDMFETMYHAQGIGLAAPQIGLSLRVMVVDVRDIEEEVGGRYALINPEVIEASRDTDRVPEGCLSIPGLEEVVERPVSVVVQGRDPLGEPVRVEAAGLLARALQHEIDHLDGILFLDRVTPLKRRMLLKKWKKSQAEAGAS